MNDERRKEAVAVLEKLSREEKDRTSGEDARGQYLADHKLRFSETLALCKRLVPRKESRILDVGQSYFTGLLSDFYESVSTLGFDPSADIGGHRSAATDTRPLPHIQFDLTEARLPDRWPVAERGFDLIVYAETIEHLAIAPEYSLMCLSTLLAENGILLVTTPNAVTFSKRVKFLLGKNPFEQIRFLRENPGHFRELTLDELCAAGRRCGLRPLHRRRVNYYNHGSLLKAFVKNLHPGFRDSLEVAFTR